jgi:hypothetical protein
MEAELARRDAAAHETNMLFLGNYALLMSVYWIGSMYETLAARQRASGA